MLNTLVNFLLCAVSKQGVQGRMVLVVGSFEVLKIQSFCFVVAIFHQVHNVEAIFHLPWLLTASGNLFRDMSDARETATTKRTKIVLNFFFF